MPIEEIGERPWISKRIVGSNGAIEIEEGGKQQRAPERKCLRAARTPPLHVTLFPVPVPSITLQFGLQ